jgi:hypothetical protein
MPTITDNSFTRDSNNMRCERLSSIQSSFSDVQSLISAPASIVTWAEDCYDVFMGLWSQSDLESNVGEGATLDANLKAAAMAQAYQNARNLALSIYKEEPVRLRDFGFDLPYPLAKNDKIARVKKVLETHSLHVAAGITNLIPENIITKLTNAKNDYETALSAQENQQNKARYANFQLSNKFSTDNSVLFLLKSWWISFMGKNDVRISMIGMVNPNTSGGRGHRVNPPEDLNFDDSTKTVRWTPVSKATSYKLEISSDGNIFKGVYSGADNFFIFKTALSGKLYLRCKGRNLNGYGEYSSVLEVG